MLFNSLPFLVFLPAVVVLYYLLPHRWRWVLLILASYFFYGYWKVEYLGLIVFSTLVDFFAAQFIHRHSSDAWQRKLGLAISLCSNLGLLAAFKYAGWFMAEVAEPLGFLSGSELQAFQGFWTFVLPVGISFYTFQTLGYTIEVYYGKAEPERNPFKFALFVSYFPQLVAGPIERFSHLHQQLFQRTAFSYENIQHGGRNILYGLFIKMCVADNISPVVDQIFAENEVASSIQLCLGMMLFGLQIYADFHGYSLIAIGTARVMGVHLMDNFNAPYFSLSIREFWSRWHISLSTWFRDYLYIPMGGNKVGKTKVMLNILVVFLVSGLWHGANWTFVVWGALHGIAYLMERLFIARDGQSWINVPRWIGTMLVVFVAWIFFRSASLDQAAAFLLNMIQGTGSGIRVTWDATTISFVGWFILSDFLFKDRGINAWLHDQSKLTRWSIYTLLVACITGFAGTVQHPFIYFQF